MDEHTTGSAGEHALQCAYGTEERAERFYREQVLDHLNPPMVDFVRRMEMAFVATADQFGECDASLRAGPPGFLLVLDAHHIAYPEYRGNGVLASLGNIAENPHIGMLLLDFTRDRIGLHINGRAAIVSPGTIAETAIRTGVALPGEQPGRRIERWVLVYVEEAYIHCRKHIPGMRMIDTADWAWDTDDARAKGGDYFGARAGGEVPS